MKDVEYKEIEMTTFKDIFKTSFLENIVSMQLGDILLSLILAVILGLFITFIYKETYEGVSFDNEFGRCLVGLCIITTFVILAVTNNVVLSLGMVGALSIVRFRAAIKEPIDIVFLFWSISVGIVLGAKMIGLAYIGSGLIGLVLYISANKKGFDIPYMLIINMKDNEYEQECLKEIQKKSKKYKLKSKTITKDNMELMLEIRLKRDESTDFINDISKLKKVSNVVLLNYNGEK